MPAKIKYPVVNGMKECGTCGATKPVSEYRKTKNYYTSRCRSCLREYGKEYRNRPEVKARTTQYFKEYSSDPTNREKKNAYLREWRKQEHIKEGRNAARRAWALREKLKAVEYKGGKCLCCGYNDCLAALEFHHRDPSEKEGYGSSALRAHWSFERNKPELDKCELVCVRCHREIHAGFKDLEDYL